MSQKLHTLIIKHSADSDELGSAQSARAIVSGIEDVHKPDVRAEVDSRTPAGLFGRAGCAPRLVALEPMDDAPLQASPSLQPRAEPFPHFQGYSDNPNGVDQVLEIALRLARQGGAEVAR